MWQFRAAAAWKAFETMVVVMVMVVLWRCVEKRQKSSCVCVFAHVAVLLNCNSLRTVVHWLVAEKMTTLA